MQAVRYHEPCAPDGLQVDQIEKPSPEPNELLVQVEAASINPVDAKYRQRGKGPLPKTTGSDFAGVVEATGEDITGYSINDRVFGTGLHVDRFQQGSFAEYITVPEDIVTPLPENVSFRTGAAVALVGVTAWRAVVDHAQIIPGDTCLIHGGTGGVGHIALQLAHRLGGQTVTTVRSKEAENLAHQLGAEIVFNYDQPNLLDAIKTETGGCDIIIDHRIDDYFQFDIDVARFGGNIVIYGGNSGQMTDAVAPRSKELIIQMMSMSNLVTKPSMPSISSRLYRLASLLKREELTVEIDDTYTLDEFDEIHYAVMEESNLGKLVIEL